MATSINILVFSVFFGVLYAVVARLIVDALRP